VNILLLLVVVFVIFLIVCVLCSKLLSSPDEEECNQKYNKVVDVFEEGIEYIKVRKFAQAIDYFSRYIERDTNSFRAYYNLGWAYDLAQKQQTRF
jgi:tetratricopeptide (TPR) repeat protein